MKFAVLSVFCLLAVSAHRASKLEHFVCDDSNCESQCKPAITMVSHDCVEMPSGHFVQSYCRGGSVIHDVHPVGHKCNGTGLRSIVPADKCAKDTTGFHKTVCTGMRHKHDGPKVFGNKKIVSRVHETNTSIKAAPKFTVCSTANAILKDIKLSSPQSNWVPGTRVTVTMTGTIQSTVTDGQLTAKAFFMGINVLDNKDNLCTYKDTPFKCPLNEGPYTVEIPFDVPKTPFGGQLTANLLMQTLPGLAEIACIDFSIALP